jgi:Uma2 family endonuclease
MGEAGLFADERVELLDGTIVTMAPNSPLHAGTAGIVHRALAAACSALDVRMQSPIVLDDWSEPEPDVAICAPDRYSYTREHPQPDQLLLLVEVAVSDLLPPR